MESGNMITTIFVCSALLALCAMHYIVRKKEKTRKRIDIFVKHRRDMVDKLIETFLKDKTNDFYCMFYGIDVNSFDYFTQVDDYKKQLFHYFIISFPYRKIDNEYLEYGLKPLFYNKLNEIIITPIQQILIKDSLINQFKKRIEYLESIENYEECILIKEQIKKIQ